MNQTPSIFDSPLAPCVGPFRHNPEIWQCFPRIPAGVLMSFWIGVQFLAQKLKISTPTALQIPVWMLMPAMIAFGAIPPVPVFQPCRAAFSRCFCILGQVTLSNHGNHQLDCHPLWPKDLRSAHFTQRRNCQEQSSANKPAISA